MGEKENASCKFQSHNKKPNPSGWFFKSPVTVNDNKFELENHVTLFPQLFQNHEVYIHELEARYWVYTLHWKLNHFITFVWVLQVGHFTQMVWNASHKVGCGFNRNTHHTAIHKERRHFFVSLRKVCFYLLFKLVVARTLRDIYGFS